MHLSTNRKNDFKEADATLEMEQRHFYQASLDYVYVLQSVQERMKFEFVELISSFLYNWMTFHTIGKFFILFSTTFEKLVDFVFRARNTRRFQAVFWHYQGQSAKGKGRIYVC